MSRLWLSHVNAADTPDLLAMAYVLVAPRTEKVHLLLC
jgi:hypothetical protein